jgi:membrane protein required for colicin V production
VSPIEIGWVDIGMLAFLVLSVLIGLVRGVVFEVLSLIGWFVAWFFALWLTPAVQPYITLGGAGTPLNHVIAFACVFLVVLLVWGIGARLVRALIRATPLSVVDRVLGAGFGVLRGAVVLLIVVLAIGFTPLAQSAAWQRSQGAIWLNSLWQELKPTIWGEAPASRDA